MTATTVYFDSLADGDEGMFCYKREFWEQVRIISLLTAAGCVKHATFP